MEHPGKMSRTFSQIVETAGFPELAKSAPGLTDVMAARVAIEQVRRKAFLDEITLTVALREMDTLIEQMSRAEGE